MMSRSSARVTLWVWLCGCVIVWAPGPLCLADCDPANQGETVRPVFLLSFYSFLSTAQPPPPSCCPSLSPNRSPPLAP